MLLKLGARGPMVRHRQHQLKRLGYYIGKLDGIYGAGTKAAVVKFQAANGLAADGIIGPATARALDRLAGGMPMPMPGMPGMGEMPTLRLGSRGPHVARCQAKLQRLGFFSGKIDGIFGPQTEAAVKAFQSAHGLTPDGIVGPKTHMALHMAA